jgi:choline/carnitine/betaine transport
MPGYGNPPDKSWWLRVDKLRLRFNPVVTTLAIISIWSFIIACITLEDAQEAFPIWKEWITRKWTWLYVGSQDAWSLFMIVLYFSKYGNLKLGKDDEEPEYSAVTWFTMLFACGIGVGLFFFGVSEPMWHYVGPNRYTQDEYIPDNTMAQIAINLTFYHWGIHGWIVYSIVGALLGIMSYREGLPMTMKSCFYPLIGDKIFTWIGDVIDTISIITTLFGVCTSLGLGCIQINAGLNFLYSDIPINQIAQVCIIWSITAMATASTISGVGMGIRRLSEICFGVGCILMTLVLFMEDTWFILNLYVQSIGYYLNWIIQLGFHCDAFELLSPSTGYGADDRGRASDLGHGDGTQDGPELWMDGWTIFYWGWWISWSPFVGMFIAKISRGRTIREFINGTLTAPIIYTFLWLTIFGGSGIAMERFAAHENLCCMSESNFRTIDKAINYTLIDANVLDPDNGNWCSAGTCSPCAVATLERFASHDMSSDKFAENLYKTQKMENNQLGDFTLIESFTKKLDYGRWKNRDVARLSCLSSEGMWFYLMNSYYDLGKFLVVFSLIGLVLYFITSSDSGSLVIDCMSANGDQDPPIPQRVFWALTEGAAATSLLVAGGTESLSALQTASVVTGLPYTFVICFMCVALWRACAVTTGDQDPNEYKWKESYFEFCTTLDISIVLRWLKNIPLGPYNCAKAATIVWGQKAWVMYIYAALAYGLFFLFVLFYFLEFLIDGSWALAWLFYILFVTVICSFRVAVRMAKGILGGPVEDWLCCLFCFPSVGAQIELELMEGLEPTKELPQ